MVFGHLKPCSLKGTFLRLFTIFAGQTLISMLTKCAKTWIFWLEDFRWTLLSKLCKLEIWTLGNCIISTRQIVQIHLKIRSVSAHLFPINDYVAHVLSAILYCVTDMCNTLYISVENKVILYASKFALITIFITLHCNYFEFKYTVYYTFLYHNTIFWWMDVCDMISDRK